MSLHSLEEFLKEHYPFNKLNKNELGLCLKNIDISYYPKDSIIISSDKIQDNFFLIIKGEVSQYDDEELKGVYHENDSFDANSLIYNKTTCTFKVSLDLICYELNKKTFVAEVPWSMTRVKDLTANGKSAGERHIVYIFKLFGFNHTNCIPS